MTITLNNWFVEWVDMLKQFFAVERRNEKHFTKVLFHR